MTKRNRIIVSIVGITIVLFALLGITYAYYLTRIEGNTNTNSISVTTADLKLSYSDGNGIVEKTNFMPGDYITKTFSVENTGENKVQGYTIVLEDVVNELTRREDLKYNLYCTLDDGTSCGKSENNLYPKTKNIAIIYANDIDKDVKHNYELIINYIYLDDIDQSDDMGSNISGKVNIYDVKDDKLNPFKTGVTATDNKSLAYNIIENARLEKNGTSLTGTPLTQPAKEINLENEKVLATTQDDYGITYYFRGNVIDNYVNFGGMCWRIVRIAGDNSIKLILEDKDYECDSEFYIGNWNIGLGNYGYDSSSNSTSGSTLYKMNYLNPITNTDKSMVKAFYDFQISKLTTFTEYLKSGDWCYEDIAYTRSGLIDSYIYTFLEDTSSYYLSVTPFYYDGYTRLIIGNNGGYYPTLKCNGKLLNEFKNVSGVTTKLSMYVSAIIADEVMYAGGKYQENNYNYYLINQYSKDNQSFWTLSPNIFINSYDHAFSLNCYGNVDNKYVSNITYAFRPVINLKSGITISSGDGTINNPYVVE